jgi:hypothetical protein
MYTVEEDSVHSQIFYKATKSNVEQTQILGYTDGGSWCQEEVSNA